MLLLLYIGREGHLFLFMLLSLTEVDGIILALNGVSAGVCRTSLDNDIERRHRDRARDM